MEHLVILQQIQLLQYRIGVKQILLVEQSEMFGLALGMIVTNL